MTLPSPAPDRTAVVTGASSGIGVEIARDLARRGHQVTLVARTESKLRALADELTGLGVRADVMPADLADRDARAALPGRLADLGLEPVVLVNNAGFSTLGPVHRSDPPGELNMIDVDVTAVVDLCSRFLPGMVERGRGAVLNVASTAAFQPIPGQAAYGASKAFVLSYTQSIATELRGTGVTATCLCPGPVDTGFGDRAGFSKKDVEEALPKVMWVDAAEVAHVGVRALDSGRRVAIPGLANQVSARFGAWAPRSLLLPVLARSHPGLRGRR